MAEERRKKRKIGGKSEKSATKAAGARPKANARPSLFGLFQFLNDLFELFALGAVEHGIEHGIKIVEFRVGERARFPPLFRLLVDGAQDIPSPLPSNAFAIIFAISMAPSGSLCALSPPVYELKSFIVLPPKK